MSKTIDDRTSGRLMQAFRIAGMPE